MKHLMRNAATSAAVAFAIAAGIWACASSGGGISGTSIVIGAIAGFGSIVVDDIVFDTTNAVVTIEGDDATVDDLRLGMFVFVRGKVNERRRTGVAERVASDHLLEGPVDGVNAGAGTFSALSQLVITDANTVFDQTTLSTLGPGELVEIFGVLDADASIRATRVERKDAITEIELTGVITNFDPVAETFQFGILTIDFSSALLESIPPGGLADGLLVEVEAEEPPVDDVLVAVGVEMRADLMFEDGDGAEIEGFVTKIVSTNEFLMNVTQRVLITGTTRFERGTRDDLVLNAEIEVEGFFESDGTLIAEEIEFR